MVNFKDFGKKILIIFLLFGPFLTLGEQSWFHLSWQVEKEKDPWLEAKILPNNYSILYLNFDWRIYNENQILTPANSSIYISLEPKFLEYSFPSNKTRHRLKLILPFNVDEFEVKAVIPFTGGQYEKKWLFKLAKPKVLILPQTQPPTVIKNLSGSFVALPLNFLSSNLSFQWEKDGKILSTSNEFKGELQGVKLKVINKDFPLEIYEKNF